MSHDADTDATVRDRLATIHRRLDVDGPIREDAESIAAAVRDAELRVRSPTATAAASLLVACRLRETPLRVTVLAERAETGTAPILNEVQRLSRELGVAVPLEDPTTIVETACRDLDLPERVERRATRLAGLGEDAGVTSGVSPYTYAAAVLYVVCSPTDVALSQAEVADHLDVSTATLRDRRDDLLAATGGRLFDRQFPDAPDGTAALADALLGSARGAEWAANKRFMGLVAGAWLYAARAYDLEVTAADVASRTGVGESTVRARYDQYVALRGDPDADGGES